VAQNSLQSALSAEIMHEIVQVMDLGEAISFLLILRPHEADPQDQPRMVAPDLIRMWFKRYLILISPDDFYPYVFLPTGIMYSGCSSARMPKSVFTLSSSNAPMVTVPRPKAGACR